jgi:hypothetical protein
MFNGSNVQSIVNGSLGLSQSPLLLDNDGHIYCATFETESLIQKLNYFEQTQRIDNYQTPTINYAELGMNNYNLSKSSILTDFTKNKYLFSDNAIRIINENYNYKKGRGLPRLRAGLSKVSGRHAAGHFFWLSVP